MIPYDRDGVAALYQRWAASSKNEGEMLSFLRRSTTGKFRIVSSGDLTALQIAEAQAEGRFYVEPGGGLGWALVPWDIATGRDAIREAFREQSKEDIVTDNQPDPNTGIDTLCERLEAHEGESFETTMCFNGVRREAAARIRGLEADNAALRASIERAAKAWLTVEGIPWHGDLADAVEAGVAKIAALRARLEKAEDALEDADAVARLYGTGLITNQAIREFDEKLTALIAKLAALAPTEEKP